MSTKSANGSALLVALVIACFIVATIVVAFMATKS